MQLAGSSLSPPLPSVCSAVLSSVLLCKLLGGILVTTASFSGIFVHGANSKSSKIFEFQGICFYYLQETPKKCLRWMKRRKIWFVLRNIPNAVSRHGLRNLVVFPFLGSESRIVGCFPVYSFSLLCLLC